MSSYGRNFSTRLFVQAAFTGFLAPVGAAGSTWLMLTFALAAGAALIGAVVRNGHVNTRELVIGYEVVAVAVGAVGLSGHHYIPGTIVGIAALVTALNHPMPRTVAVPAQAAPVEAAVPGYAPAQYAPMPAPQLAAAETQLAAAETQFAAPAPVSDLAAEERVEEPAAPMAPLAPPVTAPVTGVRAMNILPGK